jgi:hypothetical protein
MAEDWDCHNRSAAKEKEKVIVKKECPDLYTIKSRKESPKT